MLGRVHAKVQRLSKTKVDLATCMFASSTENACRRPPANVGPSPMARSTGFRAARSPELQHWPALYLCCPHRDFDVHGIDINSNIKRQKTQPEGPQPRFGEASLDCSGGLRFREGR